MIKNLIENPDDVISECINLTKEYLDFQPQVWTKAKQPITYENVAKDINNFFNAIPKIGEPTTVPDELVADMLEFMCLVESDKRQQVQMQYNQQKQVEMKLGVFLEAYILRHSFDHGWVQTGNCISGTDMIKKNSDGTWFKLQIKNSDNTPNSSSAGFLKNKAVTWKRRNSRKGTQYWHEFPDNKVRENLSEDGFKTFIKEYYLNKYHDPKLKNLND